MLCDDPVDSSRAEVPSKSLDAALDLTKGHALEHGDALSRSQETLSQEAGRMFRFIWNTFSGS